MISVVIPAYNEQTRIGRCIKSLLDNKFSDKEIIVVDDGSTDGTAAEVKKFPGVLLVKKQRTEGVTKAVQVGIKHASGDIIAKIDADSIAPNDWLERIAHYFKNEDVIAVGGSYAPLERDGAITGSVFLVERIFNEKFKRFFSVSKLIGTNWAARKRALAQGAWDNLFADEAVLSGIPSEKIRYDEAIRVQTRFPATLTEVWQRKYRWGVNSGHDGFLKPKFWIRPVYFMALLFSIAYSSTVAGRLLFAVCLIPLAVIFAFSLEQPKLAFLAPIMFLLSEFAWCLGAVNGFLKRV